MTKLTGASDQGRDLGVEFVAGSEASITVRVQAERVALSALEARQLAHLLMMAVRRNEAAPAATA